MPDRSTWLVRGALLNLILGISIGSLILAQKAFGWQAAFWAFLPLHAELLLFGFMVQFAFGVALWILPRHAVESPEGAVWPAALLLNVGIWMVGVAAWTPEPVLLGMAGRLSEIMALAVFARRMWPRLQPLRRTA